MILIPRLKNEREHMTQSQKIKHLDILGVGTLTGNRFSQFVPDLSHSHITIVALILFIFAITSATDAGWGTAHILVPLIASIFMAAGFFFWEAHLPPVEAAVYVMNSFRANTLAEFLGYQTTKYMVFAQLCAAFWCFSYPIFLVGHRNEHLLPTLATSLRLAGHQVRSTHVSP